MWAAADLWAIRGHAVRFLRLVHRGTRIPVEAILDNAEDCTLEEIVGPDIYPSVPVHVMRRVLCFARLAEAASLLQQAETIKHPLWEDESERGELAPDVLNLLQQTANEIEPAARTLAQVTYQPAADAHWRRGMGSQSSFRQPGLAHSVRQKRCHRRDEKSAGNGLLTSASTRRREPRLSNTRSR